MSFPSRSHGPSLQSSLRQMFSPNQLIPSLAAGLIAGSIAVTVSAAFAALIE